jgi:hypothetical protein
MVKRINVLSKHIENSRFLSRNRRTGHPLKDTDQNIKGRCLPFRTHFYNHTKFLLIQKMWKADDLQDIRFHKGGQ